LVWKISQGSTDNLLYNIDAAKTRTDKRIIADLMKCGGCEVKEESFWDLGQRTMSVVGEPGMGKSSTTTQVAWNIKLVDPTSWVVRINWNDNTRKLEENNIETSNLDTLVEFLCSAAFPESKYTDINRTLLKQVLQNSGNVAVLMDEFDKFSSPHLHNAAVIL